MRHAVIRLATLLLVLLVVDLQACAEQTLAASGNLSRRLVRSVAHTR